MIAMILGTNRPGSLTKQLAPTLAAHYRELGEDVDVIDLADLPPEIFSPLSYANKPEAFAPFLNRLRAADAFLVVSPEYNGSIPGILKYFIDMLPTRELFEHMPVAFIGLAAGQWGALRPIEQLQSIFGYRNAFLFPDRVFIPNAGASFDASGTFHDPSVLARIQAQAIGFVDFIARVKPLRPVGDRPE